MGDLTGEYSRLSHEERDFGAASLRSADKLLDLLLLESRRGLLNLLPGEYLCDLREIGLLLWRLRSGENLSVLSNGELRPGYLRGGVYLLDLLKAGLGLRLLYLCVQRTGELDRLFSGENLSGDGDWVSLNRRTVLTNSRSSPVKKRSPRNYHRLVMQWSKKTMMTGLQIPTKGIFVAPQKTCESYTTWTLPLNIHIP